MWLTAVTMLSDQKMVSRSCWLHKETAGCEDKTDVQIPAEIKADMPQGLDMSNLVPGAKTEMCFCSEDLCNCELPIYDHHKFDVL